MGQKIDLTSQVQGILPGANGGAGQLSGVQFVDAEVPGGAINGSNGTFTLANIPNPPASLLLFLNGTLQIQGTNYTLVGNTITMAAPASSSTLLGWYRFINLGNLQSFVETLSLSDGFAFDLIVARLPLGLIDTMTMADQMTMVFSPILFTEFMVMSDSIRISLLPLTETPAESLNMTDAIVVRINLLKTLSDSLSLSDGLVYMFDAPGNGSSAYIPADKMVQVDAPVIVMTSLKSFSEQMTQSDLVVVQMR